VAELPPFLVVLDDDEKNAAQRLGARFCFECGAELGLDAFPVRPAFQFTYFCSAACFRANGKEVNANIEEVLRKRGSS